MLAPISVVFALASTAFAGALHARAPERICGATRTIEQVAKAEAHFATNRITSNINIDIDVSISFGPPPIPVCQSSPISMYRILMFSRSTLT
jgi:hypothetical protein